MIKNSIYTALILLVFTSCKMLKTPAQEKLVIPDAYEKTAGLVQVDSVSKQESVQLQNWKVFFTDEILKDLIDTVLVANFDVQLAYQRLQQSRAGVQYTKGIRLPDLGLNLSTGVRRFGDYTIDGVGNYDTQFSTNLNDKQQLPNPVPDFYAGVYSSWEIDVWGKLKSKKKAAFSRFLASEQGKNLVLTDIISDVAQTYYTLMLLDEELEIIRQNIALQENALQISDAQMQSGKTNVLAVEMMQAQVLGSKTLQIEIEQEIIEVENKLNVLLGRYPQTVARSKWNRELEITQSLEVGIPSDLLLNRPDIQQAFFNIDAQNADLRVAKTAFYPTLQLNANVGYQAFRAALLFESPASIAYSLFGGLVTPLVNRRVLKAQLMESKANQKEAYIQLEKTVVIAFSEVFELLKKSENFNQMKKLKMEQVSTLEKSVGTSNDLFVSGRASYLEVINAQQGFLKTQLELLHIYELKSKNQVLLFRSLGGGVK